MSLRGLTNVHKDLGIVNMQCSMLCCACLSPIYRTGYMGDRQAQHGTTEHNTARLNMMITLSKA